MECRASIFRAGSYVQDKVGGSTEGARVRVLYILGKATPERKPKEEPARALSIGTGSV